ncbi:MAG: O-antigen ligase family protein, partial [Candidatus Moranbacteria bacterium]|nr:O-antigen ligase family protein [Candidatus Moranbacteria bacterium]
FLISDYFYNIAMIIQIIGLILTFSKSAIIGLATTIIYIHYGHNILSPIHKLFRACLSVGKVKQFKQKEAFKCSTWNNSQCESYEPIKIVPRGTIYPKKWLLFTGITIISLYLVKPDLNSLLLKSLDERLLYLNVSRGTIFDNPLIGLGAGQFVINMQNYTNQTLLGWQFQPVHNVFLLIWSELGIIGLALFIWMIYKLFHVEQFRQKEAIKCSTWNNSQCESYKIAKNVPRLPAGRQGGTFPNQKEFKIAIQGVLIGFMFIMLFDHYLWDIQQGQIIFWLTLGLLVSSRPANIDK